MLPTVSVTALVSVSAVLLAVMPDDSPSTAELS